MAKAKSIGTTTGNQITLTPGLVNLIDYANAVGDGVADDSDAFQTCLDSGFGVYVPGGYRFKITKPLNLNGKTNIAIVGDGAASRIEMHDVNWTAEGNARLFNCIDCENITFMGLHLIGQIITTGSHPGNPGSRGNGTPIRYFRGSGLEVERCLFEGFPGYLMVAQGTEGVRITENHCWNNSGGAWNATSGEIYCGNENDTPQSAETKGIIITENQLYSNTDLSIEAGFRPVTRATISNNIIEARDADGVTQTTPLNTFKRHGIVTSYHNIQAENATSLEISTNNNHISNIAISGIFINGTSLDVGNGVGCRHTVSGNVISEFAKNTEQGAGTDDDLIAGIQCLQHNLLTIQGNVIHSASNTKARGIQLHSYSSGSQATVTGNIVRDVAGVNIYHYREAGEATFTGNICMRTGGDYLVATYGRNASSGKLTWQGNRFIRTDGSSYIGFFNANGSTMENGSAFTFTGNTFEQRGTNSGTTQLVACRPLRSVWIGNNFIGNGSSTANAKSGLVFLGTAPTGREQYCVVDSNVFKGVVNAIQYTAGVTASGPMVACDNRYEDVSQAVSSSTFWEGNRGATTVEVWDPNASNPSSGTWEAGDIRKLKRSSWAQTTPLTSGTPVKWMCTSRGVGSAATWAVIDVVP